MRSLLFALPFLGLFLLCTCLAMAALFNEGPALVYGGWVLFFSCLLALLIGCRKPLLKLYRQRGLGHTLSLLGRPALGLFILLALAILSNRPRFDRVFDATQSQSHALSPASRKVIAQYASGPALEVVAYSPHAKEARAFAELLRLYQQEGLQTQVTYRDPLSEAAQAKADRITNGSDVILRIAGREQRLASRDEAGLTASLVSLMRHEERRVYFTVGHGEGDLQTQEAHGLARLAAELVTYRFAALPLDLSGVPTVPSDAALVVIAGPQSNFAVKELHTLRTYLRNGGTLLVMADSMRPVDSLNELLASYHLALASDFIVLPPDDPRVKRFGQNTTLVTDFTTSHPLTATFAASPNRVLQATDARSLSLLPEAPSSLQLHVLARSAPENIRVRDVYGDEDLAELSSDRIERGPFVIAACAEATAEPPHQKGARVLVIGSAQIASNAMLAQAPAHRDFVVSAVNYLAREEHLTAALPQASLKGTLVIDHAESVVVLALLCFVYPLLFLGSSGLVWLRRRQA